jgi:predicted dehydrogenase
MPGDVFRWGIFGTGTISMKFVAGLASARDAKATLVASRSLATAQHFATSMGIERSIEGYAEAALAGGVDAVYVATPPSEHAANAISCIEAGIPVLVEKPFAATADDARRIADAARAHGVFAMEGMWTRFLPAAQALRDATLSGEVGRARMVSGSFGSSATPDPSSGKFDPARGGGAIAHLGVYPLSLGLWLFGTPDLLQAVGTIGETGVDEDAAFQLRYPGGVVGSFFVSIRSWAADDFRVMGTDGMISVSGSIVRPHGLDVVRQSPTRAPSSHGFGRVEKLRQHPLVHQVAQRADRSSRRRGTRHAHRYAGSGYHYEADEVRACVERGSTESSVMPLDDSIAVAVMADSIRSSIRQQPDPSQGTT